MRRKEYIKEEIAGTDMRGNKMCERETFSVF